MLYTTIRRQQRANRTHDVTTIRKKTWFRQINWWLWP